MGCFTGRRGNEPMSKMQNGPAQRYSKMSNLKVESESSLPQRHSKMSNGRLSGLLCWPHGQKGIFTMKIKNIEGWFMANGGPGYYADRIGQNRPAQPDSVVGTDVSNKSLDLFETKTKGGQTDIF